MYDQHIARDQRTISNLHDLLESTLANQDQTITQTTRTSSTIAPRTKAFIRAPTTRKSVFGIRRI